MEEFRGISVGEVSPCSLVNAWLCASDEEGKEEEEETVVETIAGASSKVESSRLWTSFGKIWRRYLSSYHRGLCIVLARRNRFHVQRDQRRGELVINNGGKF